MTGTAICRMAVMQRITGRIGKNGMQKGVMHMNDRKMVLDGIMGLVVGDALGCHIASGLYYFIAKAIVTMAPKNADFITCIQCGLEKGFACRSFSIKTGLLFRSHSAFEKLYRTHQRI